MGREYTKAQKNASLNYEKEHLKRIPLSVKKQKYEEIKMAADSVGESVNGFIKKAVDERMARLGTENGDYKNE